ncbi:uncharacterized protein [Fopius arisanus]|uniref:DUF4806 domain-containing protein n=1 Tax=Fopius arisanus TaxID=64838 RepID=A0A9R1TSU6_9HYME|nr:PREDICTED: uncharacterized protein LOC105273741 [Fopius arisanus]
MEECEKVYQIVEFVEEMIENGKKSLEIVPASWVTRTEGTTTGTCAFPPPNQYHSVSKMVKELIPPQSSWKTFGVELLTSAKNYDKAERRINRLYRKRSNIDSTDSETEASCVGKISKNQAAAITRRTFSLLEHIVEEREAEREAISSRDHEAEISKDGGQQRSLEEAGATTLRGRTESGDTKGEKKFALKAVLKTLRENAIEDPLKQFCADYWDATTELLTYKYREDLSSLKRSIQYDLNRKIEELRVSMMVCNVAGGEPITSPREGLSADFPIKSFEQFLDFEKTLDPTHQDNLADPEKALQKQDILKAFMGVLTNKGMDYAADIKKILKELISKEVQLNYSGVGRVVKGRGKRNFSATLTFACLRDFIEGKYKNSNIPLKIISITSDWLSGAGDRDGGCSQRKKQGGT